MIKIVIKSSKYGNKIVTIDDCDKWLLDYTWHLKLGKNTFYAITNSKTINVKTKTKSMHRIILGLSKPTEIVDHIDGNGLNNTRTNLRVVSLSQNAMNSVGRPYGTSQYKGVFWNKAAKKWCVRIQHQNETQHLGCFTNEKNAALVYDYWARKYYKEYARLNIPSVAISDAQCRKLTRTQRGTSKYTGVLWRDKLQKWQAVIIFKGQRYNLGYYIDEIDAAKAYNDFIIEHNAYKHHKVNYIEVQDV